MSGEQLDQNQLARQRKKIAKDKRRKQYDDLQVQGTNNSSIVSKRSVEMLYTSKLNPEIGEWFKYFVKKPKRRSPAINRGYWIRMESIKQMCLRIISSRTDPNQEVTIVNLGCGFDPLPFQLLSHFKGRDDGVKLNFLDIDYPELIENKLAMIRDSPDILSILGNETTQESIDKQVIPFETENYKLVGCDLKDSKLYHEILSKLLGDNTSVKIFVAEVSLAYMKPQHANPIIENSAKMSNSHFLILEQILPSGKYHAFAQKMLYHFNHLRSPLQCVETYPLKDDQVRRFKNYYSSVEIKNLFENWMYLIDEDVKRKVDSIEAFDEWEEFIIFCQHYVIVHATNRDFLIYDKEATQPQELGTVDESVQLSCVEASDSDLLQLKFPAICSNENEVIVHGGLFQSRTDKTVSLINDKIEVKEVIGDIPTPRMCHTLTAINDKESILIGGRSQPNHLFQDVFKLHENKWIQLKGLPGVRSRHSVVKLNNEELLIFGGLPVGDQNDLFLIYNHQTQQCTPLKVHGSISNISSCAIAYNTALNYGVIVGGMTDTQIPEVNDTAYKFTIINDSVEIKVLHKHSQFLRISAQCKFISNKKLLLIGGASPLMLLNQEDTIITFDIDTSELHPVKIEDNIWKDHPPIFIGFGQAEYESQTVCIGGGAVCYSFGSCYNGIYTIKYDVAHSSILM